MMNDPSPVWMQAIPQAPAEMRGAARPLTRGMHRDGEVREAERPAQAGSVAHAREGQTPVSARPRGAARQSPRRLLVPSVRESAPLRQTRSPDPAGKAGSGRG